MKIYTKTGDSGHTGLFGGARVAKHHPRVVAYGCVDEANSALGVASAFITDALERSGDLPATVTGPLLQVAERIGTVQSDLFTMGAQFASVRESEQQITRDAVTRLEGWIDDADADLPALKTFILPGGSLAAAQMHVARTVVRRAERAGWELFAAYTAGDIVTEKDEGAGVSETPLVYLNRLSDLAFNWARLLNTALGVQDTPWKP